MIGWILLIIGLGILLAMLSFAFAFANEGNYDMSLVEHLTDLEFREAWIRMAKNIMVIVGFFAFAVLCIVFGATLLSGG